MKPHIREILHEYEQMRLQKKAERDARESEALRRCPELAAVLEQMRNLSLNMTREVMARPAQADEIIQRSHETLSQLRAQKEALLLQCGLPADTLEIHYRCPDCKDTGYIGDVLQQMCHCLSQRVLEESYRSSNLAMPQQNAPAFDLNIFSNKPISGSLSPREQMRRIYDHLSRLCSDLDSAQHHTILLCGKTGTGKTFLLQTLAQQLVTQGTPTLMLTSYKFFDLMLKHHTHQEDVALDDFTDVDVLILDDLGSEPLFNNVTVQYLFSILNERLYHQKHTFISTNLLPAQLASRYGDRVASRLLDPQNTLSFQLLGRDLRMHQK